MCADQSCPNCRNQLAINGDNQVQGKRGWQSTDEHTINIHGDDAPFNDTWSRQKKDNAAMFVFGMAGRLLTRMP
jgi:hypothetical protein